MTTDDTLQTVFIASTAENAASAAQGGADVIMVDLEREGKQDRQKTLAAHMTSTDWDDVAAIRDATPADALMIRLDPWHPDRSPAQIDRATALGADRLMLPMIETLEHVTAFAAALDGRTRFTPLIETVSSLEMIDAIAAMDSVDRLHIGLNDLHLQRHDRFLFEPLANGVIDPAAAGLVASDMPFGIGGIGALSDTPPVSPTLLLAEHARLGSSWVILSRRFRDMIAASPGSDAVGREIAALKARYRVLCNRDAQTVAEDRQKFVAQVRGVVSRMSDPA
ncbi:aldolase/citrate lyase family protein (plasmid) [Sulfitobacter sp. TCYB15]|uniref:Aldolase/citrate lyase family protein n=1 Tax=Sulfitobacter sp. TCYB15 TaxID=3229275 RepID=A0AAU8C888_9RHOB